MSAEVIGRMSWSMTREKEGGREYQLVTRVRADYDDGPATVMFASGLPMIGSYWAFGGDLDPWAFCTPQMTLTPEVTNEPNRFWTIEQTFATPGLMYPVRCQDANIADPLLEPPKISGSFNRYQKEAKVDRHGKMIKSSSHEKITGIEMDGTRPSVIFEWNTAVLDIEGMCNMINTLNDRPMWGVDARHIKLTNISWSRLMYGVCAYYFSKRFEFEVRFDGFDEDKILDTGFRCLKGTWVAPGTASATTGGSPTWTQDPDADEDNPDHFIRVKDYVDDPTPTRVPLDGHGGRLTDPTTPVFIDKVELYDESNFLAYGVPSSLF